MSFTLDQLRALVAIERAGNFSAAGRQLYRATSAVSYAIKNLEEQLGVTLFDRRGHQAKLTDEGRRVLQEAHVILGQAEKLTQIADRLQEGWEPHIDVIVDGLFPLPPIMQALRRFKESNDVTRVRVVTEYLGGVPERFAREEADLMFTLYVDSAQSDLEVHPLPALEMILVAESEHPLHDLPKPRSAEDLSSFTELVVSDSAETPVKPFENLHIGAPGVFELSDFQSKREAILGGVGYGWLPAHLAGDLIDAGKLVPVAFERGDTYRLMAFGVLRSIRGPGRAARQFMDLVLEEFNEEG